MADQEQRVSPDLPWSVNLFLSMLSFAVDISRRSNITVNRRLMSFFDFKSSPSKKPINGVISSDVTVDATRNLWFRLFTPTVKPEDGTGGADPLPVIVYFHGGGFVFMAANSKVYNDWCQRLAREVRAVFVSVNYRLSPEHRYPSQYEDGIDVLKFIDATLDSSIPVDLNRCFLAGDSAGGNIAHHVAIRANDHEFSKLNVVGLISLQPFFGGEERTEPEKKLVGSPLVSMERADWMWKAFLPEGSDRDHPAVNVFGPRSADLSPVKFPATIVFVGGFDPLKEWQKKYYEGLKKCGKEARLVEYPKAIHSFYAFPEFSESSLLIQEVKNFIGSH